MRKLAVIGVLGLSSSLVVLAYAAGNWNAARTKAEAVKREHKDLRRATPFETHKIVKAICEAEEGKRKVAAKSAGRRAKDKVTREYTRVQTASKKDAEFGQMGPNLPPVELGKRGEICYVWKGRCRHQ